MHFFDPTVDWPKDLLDPLVPDLFVVRSKISIDSNSPWNDPSKDPPWNTPWIEYAALDKEEQFVNMTFFNTRLASRDEKKLISERSDQLDDGTRSTGWYRSTSSIDKHFAALQEANAIRCWMTKSTPRTQTFVRSVSPITFRKMSSHRSRQALEDAWNHLTIEPLEEGSDVEFAMPAGWEAELEQTTEAVSKDRQSDEADDQAEILRLYIVSSSKKLDSGQPSDRGFPDDRIMAS